jgi:hypothetical protein
MNKWYRSLLKNTIVDEEKLLDYSGEEPYMIGCDGGLKDEKGSFGIVIKQADSIIITNKSRIPDIYNKLSSFIGELFGILCGIIYLKKIQQYKQQVKPLSPTEAIIWCDNLASINIIKKLDIFHSIQKRIISQKVT